MKANNKVEAIVPDKYFKSTIINPMDDFFVGVIKYLREQGRRCEFLGFNIWNGHVVLIDGAKYYTGGLSTLHLDCLASETFYALMMRAMIILKIVLKKE